MHAAGRIPGEEPGDRRIFAERLQEFDPRVGKLDEDDGTPCSGSDAARRPARRAYRDRAGGRFEVGNRQRHMVQPAEHLVAHMHHVARCLRLLPPRSVDLGAHRAPHRLAHDVRRRGACALRQRIERLVDRLLDDLAERRALGVELRMPSSATFGSSSTSPLSESTIATLIRRRQSSMRRRSATPLPSCETISRPSRYEPAVRDLVDDLGRPGRETDHLAVADLDHLRHAGGARELCLLMQMQRLAVDRHDDLRLRPVVDLRAARRGADGRRCGRARRGR